MRSAGAIKAFTKPKRSPWAWPCSSWVKCAISGEAVPRRQATCTSELAARSLSQSLSAIRGFHAFLDRRLDTPAPQLALVRGPRIKTSLPRPVSEDQARGLLQEPDADADAEAWEAARDRALTEATAFAIRIDVAEELTRLASHLDEIERLLQTGKDLGKRLDFLIQELHREANTLGAKAAALELTQISVSMKVLIEQMREQVQNIE